MKNKLMNEMYKIIGAFFANKEKNVVQVSVFHGFLTIPTIIIIFFLLNLSILNLVSLSFLMVQGYN